MVLLPRWLQLLLLLLLWPKPRLQLVLLRQWHCCHDCHRAHEGPEPLLCQAGC
jgi:hypothetical protein